MNEEKKRVRRSGAELIAAKKADLKRTIAKQKAEKQAKKAKFAVEVLTVLEKVAGRELCRDDLPYLTVFLKECEEEYKKRLAR